jgi:hypothetical protein
VAGITSPAPTPATELQTRMTETDRFHAWLGAFKHANTWAIYSTGLDTDMAVHFDATSPNRGVNKVRRAQGDGTVPATSASSLFTAAETAADPTGKIFTTTPTKRQCELSGIEHGAACNDSTVQTVVEQMLLAILGCVCPPSPSPQGDYPTQETTDQQIASNGDDTSDNDDDGGDGNADSTIQYADAGQSTPPDPSDWSTNGSDTGSA